MKALNNDVIIRTPNGLIKKETMKHGSLEVVIPMDSDGTQHNPRAVHNWTTGYVVSVSDKVNIGVMDGDKIHFHFNAIDDHSPIKLDNETVFKIDGDDVLCIERDNEIIPAGYWVLCEPIYDQKVTDLDESKFVTSKSGILLPGTKEIHNTSIAKVCYINDNEEIKPGDTVYFAKNADFDNIDSRINGKKYFYIRYDDIYGKLCL